VARRGWLWAAFVVVHLGVATLGWVMPNQPMGDVYLVYEPWSRTALNGGGIVGITEAWVYPQLALVPMVLAHGFGWIHGYIVGWAILVILCNALAFWMLIGRGASRGRRAAAWFWLLAIACLGPVGLYRIDAITVPLALAGCMWLVGPRGWGRSCWRSPRGSRCGPRRSSRPPSSRCVGAWLSSAAPPSSRG